MKLLLNLILLTIIFLSASKFFSQNLNSLENTEWEGDTISTPLADRSTITTYIRYYFYGNGKLVVKIITHKTSGFEQRLRNNVQTNQLEYYDETTPPSLKTINVFGSYRIKGKNVFIDFNDSSISSSLDGKTLTGILTDKNKDRKDKWSIKYSNPIFNADKQQKESAGSVPSKAPGTFKFDFSDFEAAGLKRELNGEKSPYPNVVRNADGTLRPAGCYSWVNKENPNDYKVEITPGLEKMSIGCKPTKGYRWINPKDANDFRVERVP
jgi:hypothetical protein